MDIEYISPSLYQVRLNSGFSRTEFEKPQTSTEANAMYREEKVNETAAHSPALLPLASRVCPQAVARAWILIGGTARF